MKLTRDKIDELEVYVGNFVGVLGISKVIDYQTMDNGRFEVLVFKDTDNDCMFLIMQNKEPLTYGRIAKPKTAAEVLSLYIRTVRDSTITYEPYGGAVKLLDRGEYLDG